MIKANILTNWKTAKAREVFAPVTDKSHNGKLQVLSATQDRGIVPRSEMDIDIKFDENSLPTYKKVSKGNFVIHLRSFQGGLAYSRVEGIISPAYTILEPKVPICDEFYEQFFKSSRYIKQLEVTIYGIRDGKQISYDEFGRLPIPFPPLTEQRAIAEILTTADRAIALRECYIVAKQKQKRWLMQNLLTGKMRLPGFNGEWKKVMLNDCLTERKQRNRNNRFTKNEVLSVSREVGIVNQIKHMGRTYAGSSVQEYHIVEQNDIVYTKSPLKNAPYGIIKANFGAAGIVSTLYAVYVCENLITAKYLDCYFSCDTYLNNYLRPLVRKGAKNDMKVNNEIVLTGKIFLPPLKEQQAIAEILTTANCEIELLNRELEQQRQVKKYLMQQLLTGRNRVKGAVK